MACAIIFCKCKETEPTGLCFLFPSLFSRNVFLFPSFSPYYFVVSFVCALSIDFLSKAPHAAAVRRNRPFLSASLTNKCYLATPLTSPTVSTKLMRAIVLNCERNGGRRVRKGEIVRRIGERKKDESALHTATLKDNERLCLGDARCRSG